MRENCKYGLMRTGRCLREDSTRARNWKRRTQPRVDLTNAEPVLYSTQTMSTLASGYAYMKPDVMEKTVRITNEFFDVGAKVSAAGVYTNQFIRK